MSAGPAGGGSGGSAGQRARFRSGRRGSFRFGRRGGGFRLGLSFVGRAAPVLAVGGAAAYLAAARMHGAAPAGPGIATAGTPGVPSWLASQGNAAAKACDANGQSCLPG